MKTTTYVVLTLAAAMAANADFSYTSTRKPAAGVPAAAGGPATTKHYLKGQKMKTDSGDTSMIMDFEAQIMTSVNNAKKTYSVMKFSDLGDTLKRADVETHIDVKETGEKKTINGFNASEVVMTMEMETPQATQAGMKMQMEVDMWLSSDVPGTKELRAFYQKNSGNTPWAAMAGGANSGMQKAMADMQKKIANLGGVPVLQIIRMKSAGGGAQVAQMQKGMEQARATLEAMAARGGPQAEMAKQQLARMGAMTGGGGGGSLFEVTTESTDFSTSSIPDSIFAIPAGFTKTESPLGRMGATPPPQPRR